jgi:tetratricopeptide (TPR) repeat protein
MNALRSPLAVSVALLLGINVPLGAQAPAPAPAPAPTTLDVQDMQKAEAAMAQSNYEEALKLAQGISQNYPTSGLIPGSNLVAAVCYFYLKDYDKAVESANKNLAPTAKNVPPEVLERSAILVPNILVTKGLDLPENQAQLRKKTFDEAIKAYDDFMKRFPQSEDVESALSGKGRALAMNEDFENATKVFKEALQKFPQSPTIQDTKYLAGLASAQQGMKAAEKAPEAGKAALDEAEKQFREIIAARQDLVLMNNSSLQIGDVFSVKASFAPKGSDEQKKLNEQALDFFRGVQPKDVVVQAQQNRIAFWRNQIEAARQRKDIPGFRRNQRVLEKETEKMESVKGASDQSIAAKLRSVGIFLAMDKFDEARVLLRFMDGYIDDTPENAEDKKKVGSLLTLTYAAQHSVDKAVPAYDKFKEKYKNDPAGENLALMVGLGFIDQDPKINSPEKAIEYFKKQRQEFPKSKAAAQAVAAEANALSQLGRYDDAVKSLKDLIASSKDKDLLAEAEFNLAVVYREMKKTDEALAAFKAVRDKYAGTPQAEQAAFWVGQMTPDAKQRIVENNSFIEKFSKSSLVPSAYYFKGMAQNDSGDQASAIKTFRELIEKFPEAEPTPGAYFETAKILRTQAEAATTKGKPDYNKVRDLLLKEFVVKFPQSDKVYASYAFSSELFTAEDKNEEAVKTYQDYIAAYPNDPNVAKAHLAIGNLYKTMADKVGPSYLAMGKADQEKWASYMNAAVTSAEQGIQKFPDSDEVSRLLELLLNIDKTRLNIGLKKEDDVKGYFTQLAGKFEGKSTKPKILFALANFLADRDKEKKGGWFEIMEQAFNDQLVFSPSDLDRFGTELVKRKQLDKAKAVFAKLEQDYPVPPNTEPGKVTRTTGDAQAVAIAGKASILQAQGKAAEGQALFEKLKELYPWSGKVAEAEFGIANGLYEQKKYEEASDLLRTIAVKTTAPVPLRARAMMLLAKSSEALKDYDVAINNYIKIAAFFESERDIAAEGLYLGAQLQERQAKGEIPKSAAKPRAATPKKTAASPKPGAATPKPGAATPKATPKPKPGANTAKN